MLIMFSMKCVDTWVGVVYSFRIKINSFSQKLALCITITTQQSSLLLSAGLHTFAEDRPFN